MVPVHLQHPLCWFLMWKPNGLQPIKCFIHCFNYSFISFKLIYARSSTWLSQHYQLLCITKQGPPRPQTQQCRLGVPQTYDFMAEIVLICNYGNVCHKSTHAFNDTCDFSRLTGWYQEYSPWSSQLCVTKNLVSWMPTASWVTITTSLTCLPSTHGPHVRRIFSNQLLSNFVMLLVLDLRISYNGMKVDYADDLVLSNHLKQSKLMLFNYFNENYTNIILVPSSLPSMSVQSAPMAAGLPQKSFMARYHRKEKTSINELAEYFKLPAEDFDACNLIHWWFGWRAQFPNLFCMAHDILCIPGELSVLYNSPFQTSLGSAVAVERIFSGGHDTISLRHASLHADTICILMLVKKQLHLARAQANAALRHWTAWV